MSDRITEKLRHEYMASHGIVVDRARFPLRQRGPLSGLGAGHQLRGALGQGSTPSTLKTRPDLIGLSGQSSGGHLAMLVADAAERSALCRDPAAGRLAGAGCQRALRDHVVAGDQSARAATATPSARSPAPIRRNGRSPSSPRQDSYWRSEDNMAEGNPMLALERGEKVADPAGDLVPGPRRHAARLQGRRLPASPATSRSASSPTTARPAARSRSTTSTCDRQRRPLAGPDQDRRHVRAHGRLRAPPHQNGLMLRSSDCVFAIRAGRVPDVTYASSGQRRRWHRYANQSSGRPT